MFFIVKNIYLPALLLFFAPSASGAVHGWAVGIIFLFILSAAVFFLLQQRQDAVPLQSAPPDKAVAALLALTACSCFFSVHSYASIVAAGQLVSYLIFYGIIRHISRSRSVLIFFLYWIVGVSTLLCAAGLVQRSGPDIFPWLDCVIAPQQEWLTSTFNNHNHLAGWLEMSMPLLLCLILFGCQRKWLPLQLLLLLLQGSCLILTYSRGGWVGAAASLLFISAWMLTRGASKTRWMIAMFGGLTALAVSAPLLASPKFVQRLHTIGLEDRMLIWRGTLDMIWANWLAGTGPGTYSSAFAAFQPPGFSHRYHTAHNDYLQFTAELGVGLPVLIVWMGAARDGN